MPNLIYLFLGKLKYTTLHWFPDTSQFLTKEEWVGLIDTLTVVSDFTTLFSKEGG